MYTDNYPQQLVLYSRRGVISSIITNNFYCEFPSDIGKYVPDVSYILVEWVDGVTIHTWE